MLALDYIKKLHALIDEHGNLEVVDSEEVPLGNPEWNDDGAPATAEVFVLCKES